MVAHPFQLISTAAMPLTASTFPKPCFTTLLEESYLLEQSKQSLGHVAGHSSPPGQNGQKQSSDLASMLPT